MKNIKVDTYNVTYNSEVECIGNNGFRTIEGTGIQLYLQFGTDEQGNQVFKRILDKDKNIVGQYNNLDKKGYIGKKEYKNLTWWMRGINKETKCKVY